MSIRDFKAKIRLWLSDNSSNSGFGDGRIELLKSIEQHGSLAKASESLNISYRKAWGDIKKLEDQIDAKLLIKHRGGKSGGEMKLTELGKRWVLGYASFRKEVEEATIKSYNSHILTLTEENHCETK